MRDGSSSRCAPRSAAALVALALAGCGGGQARPHEPPEPHGHDLTPVTEAAPARPDGRWLTARVRDRVALRAAPRASARVLARLGRRTEFGSPLVLGVLRRRDGWLAVGAPQLPNGRTGWIPEQAAELRGTDLAVHVDLSARRLELRDGRRVLRHMPVAVGRPDNPTPLGRYAVTDRLHTNRTDSPYGCCAIALTGHQTDLPAGWPGGDRLAIHATPQAETIGEAASLGCLRAPTRGIRALMRRLALGTPVFVRR